MKKSWLGIFMGVLFFGSVWGVLEATMGNVLHFIGLHPYTGLIMTSISLGLMAFARRLYKRRGIGIFMGIIAASIKAIDFFIPGSNVLRPIIAILLTACTFEAVMAVSDKAKSTDLNRAIAGFTAGYVSIAAFAYFTAYVLKFNYWLKMGALGILKYLALEGWKFGLGGMICFLLGTNFVKLGILKISLDKLVKKRAFYLVSVVFTIVAVILAVII